METFEPPYLGKTVPYLICCEEAQEYHLFSKACSRPPICVAFSHRFLWPFIRADGRPCGSAYIKWPDPMFGICAAPLSVLQLVSGLSDRDDQAVTNIITVVTFTHVRSSSQVCQLQDYLATCLGSIAHIEEGAEKLREAEGRFLSRGRL